MASVRMAGVRACSMASEQGMAESGSRWAWQSRPRGRAWPLGAEAVALKLCGRAKVWQSMATRGRVSVAVWWFGRACQRGMAQQCGVSGRRFASETVWGGVAVCIGVAVWQRFGMGRCGCAAGQHFGGASVRRCEGGGSVHLCRTVAAFRNGEVRRCSVVR